MGDEKRSNRGIPPVPRLANLYNLYNLEILANLENRDFQAKIINLDIFLYF